MKNSYYFPHDYHARHDPKLEKLRMEVGPVSDGIFWDLVEMLYEQEGYLLIKDLPFIAKILNTTKELVEKVVNQSNLFIKQGDTFTSTSLLGRLNHIKGKRWKAKVSANKRWDANAMRTQCERNAIKYSKVKYIKEKYIKEITIPPKLEDIASYCQERKNTVDPHKWYNHYQAKGWFIGKNKMRDWQAAVRTWEKPNPGINHGPVKRPLKLRILEMTALKITGPAIKQALLADDYNESEIDRALRKEY